MAVDLGEGAPDNGVDAWIEAEDVDAHLGCVGVGEFGSADVAALAGAVEHLDAAVVALERFGHEEGDGGGRFAEGGVERRVGASQQGVGGGGCGVLQEGDAGDGEQGDEQSEAGEQSLFGGALICRSRLCGSGGAGSAQGESAGARYGGVPPSKSPPRMGGDFQIDLLTGLGGFQGRAVCGFLPAQE